MKIQLLRHATLLIDYAGHRILLDPMLSAAGMWAPIAGVPNQHRIPLVDLPMGENALSASLASVELVLVTHTHLDHWDDAAAATLSKELPLFCQPSDTEKLLQQGFAKAKALDPSATWNGITITRTGGQHGLGEIGTRIGPVSGFVLAAPNEPTLYVAGDTVWCPEVEAAVTAHKPGVAVLNAGGAMLSGQGPITMDVGDLEQFFRASGAQLVAVHMDVINHCVVTRDVLRAAVPGPVSRTRLHIPADGETLTFGG